MIKIKVKIRMVLLLSVFFFHTAWGFVFVLVARDKTIKIWNLKIGEMIKMLEGHEGAVQLVVFSPDYKILASGSNDRTVKIWDTLDSNPKNWKEIKTLRGHKGGISSVTWNQEGICLASGSDDRTVKLWDMSGLPDNWKLMKTLEFEDSVQLIEFSLDGKYLLAGNFDKGGKITRWDAKTGKLIGNIRIADEYFGFFSEVLNREGTRLALVGEEDEIEEDQARLQIWDTSDQNPNNWKLIKNFKDKYPMALVEFTPDGKYLIAVSWAREITIWNIKTWKIIRNFKDKCPMALEFTPDGKYLIAVSQGGEITIWNIKTWKIIRNFKTDASFIGFLVANFNKEGTRFALVGKEDDRNFGEMGFGNDIRLQMWDTSDSNPKNWKEIKELRREVYVGNITSLVFKVFAEEEIAQKDLDVRVRFVKNHLEEFQKKEQRLDIKMPERERVQSLGFLLKAEIKRVEKQSCRFLREQIEKLDKQMKNKKFDFEKQEAQKEKLRNVRTKPFVTLFYRNKTRLKKEEKIDEEIGGINNDIELLEIEKKKIQEKIEKLGEYKDFV